MKIKNGLTILRTQSNLKRTPYGWPTNDDALNIISVILEDEGNYDAFLVQCKNCGFVFSELLSSGGCHNCGCLDLQKDILEEKITK